MASRLNNPKSPRVTTPTPPHQANSSPYRTPRNVVHPGHHPRLACLHEALASLRSVLPPAAWAADWRDACDRLHDLRQRVGEGPWAQALARVTDADREIVSHLLTGSLDT
jgi:hypothetical protein